MTDILERERDGGLVVLTLNRPEALNAMSMELRAALVTAFEEIAEDETCEVVILTGAGRAFSAGLDLKELGGEAESAGAVAAVTSREVVEAMASVRL